ncbi:hypothetical protein GCM10022405_01880 [Gibbsiella dentisursi]|uniref:Uncharacterized protein n=1 Tax=Gibbsiella dentisursi TaxID=796890 RepID=A0ABP7KJM0_9GAMM
MACPLRGYPRGVPVAGRVGYDKHPCLSRLNRPSVADCPWQRCLARQPKMRAEGQNTNLLPPGNLTSGFDTIKDNAFGEWSTGVEAIEGAERRNVA